MPSNLSSKPSAQLDLRHFQQQLISLFTNGKERQQFLQSTGTEYATYQDIQSLPKTSVSIYADLLKTTTDAVLSSIFPAVRTYFSEQQWADVLEHYLPAFPVPHYRLNSIAQNFSLYLEQLSPEKPWLSELADYEYQELAVEENQVEPSNTDSFRPLLSQTEIINLGPVINQTLCHRRYKFDVVDAVQSILVEGARAITPSKQFSIVVFFRDPESHRCRQLKLGTHAEAVLLAAMEGKLTYAQILSKCLATASKHQKQQLEDRLSELLAIINDFHEANLFTGNQDLTLAN
jgi:hypothetical protein